MKERIFKIETPTAGEITIGVYPVDYGEGIGYEVRNKGTNTYCSGSVIVLPDGTKISIPSLPETPTNIMDLEDSLEEEVKDGPAFEYDTGDLVSFGNYLLSIARDNVTSPSNKRSVTEADLANWKAANKS